jgi:hypothetical protein
MHAARLSASASASAPALGRILRRPFAWRSFFRNSREGRTNGEQNEAKTMKTTATTLEAVQRALEEQDRHLDAAYRVLTDQHSGRPVAIPIEAIDRLGDLCEPRVSVRTLSKASSGVRC